MKIGILNHNEIDIHVYDGIDIHLARKHSKDGSDGFIIFFLNTTQFYGYEKVVKREQQIDELISQKLSDDYYSLQSLDNNYIAMYHCNYDNDARMNIAKQLFEIKTREWIDPIPAGVTPIDYKK